VSGMTDRNGIKIVPIDSVQPATPMDSYFTRKMKLVLLKQGQIIPLQINKRTNATYHVDAHGAAIWHAAKDLGWDTLLVLFNDKYEE
jgi:hypothetical protein